MSHRADLAVHRAAIQDRDEPLRVIEVALGTSAARYKIARARSLLRAGDQMLAAALRLTLPGDGEGRAA